jgi:hypothetical protein
MKSKYTTVEFPVFSDYIVHIEITSDIKESFKKYKYTRNLDMSLEDTQAVAVHVENTGMSMIFLPYNASVGTIAHESWHVIRRMMEYLGADQDNEMMGYHLGYLVQKVFNFMRGKRV